MRRVEETRKGAVLKPFTGATWNKLASPKI